MSRDLRAARYRVVLTFLLGGLICGSFTVRIPAMVDKIDMSKAWVGAVLLIWGLAALVTMQSIGGVMARTGSRTVLRAGLPLCALSLLGVAFAPSLPWLVGAVALFGALFGVIDVGMNTQASAVERACGRPVMSGMHAGWCIGAMAAGALGTIAISLGMSFAFHLSVISVAALAIGVLTSRGYLPDAAPQQAERGGRRVRRLPPVVYLLGGIAFASFMVEGAIADWNGLFLRGTIGTSEAVAAVGNPMFQVGMLASRFLGDRLRGRFGARTLIAASGLGVAASFTLVVATSSATVVIVGDLLVGATIATLLPMSMSLAGEATDTPGAAVAQAGAISYAGLLLGPVVIGFLAEATTLRLAMGLSVPLGLAIALAARFLPATSAVERTESNEMRDTPQLETV